MSEVNDTDRPADAIDCFPAAKSAENADESCRFPDAIDRLKEKVEWMKHMPTGGDLYHKGFVDGLNRAIEIIQNEALDG